MNIEIAENINTLGRFCGLRDIDTLSRDALNRRYGIDRVDVMVLFGGSILADGDVLAEAIQNGIAKKYIIVGGEGHTTETLRATVHREYPEIETAGLPEAEVFQKYLRHVHGCEADAIAFGYESLAGYVGTSTFAASMGLTNCPPLIVDYPAPAEGTTSAIRYSAVKQYEPYFTETTMSKGVVPSDAQEEFDFTCEGLEDSINAYAADAILNGVTDENWNAYLETLDSLNYDYYIEFYQNKLDGNW